MNAIAMIVRCAAHQGEHVGPSTYRGYEDATGGSELLAVADRGVEGAIAIAPSWAASDAA